MADLIDLPEGNRKWLWIGGTAAAAGVAYFWWKRGHGAGAAGDGADLTGGEVAQAGGAYVNPNPGAHGAGSVDATGGVSDPNTGEEWSQRVLGDLPLYGWDSQFVAMTLGKYLAGNPLTPDEVQLIQTAWALYGRPAGAPAINVGGASTPTGGGGTAPRVIVPRRTTPLYPTDGVTRLSPFTPAPISRRIPL
jgi:hypothetical protein